ncbi:MAG: DUF4345 family protein [Planctomycetota bacterium]|jgi:hypothetical protein
MTRIVLMGLGALYLALGIWSALAPERVARLVGLSMEGGSGRSEFIVVYGGLELALGIFFCLAGLQQELHQAGLLLAMVLSVTLAAFRAVTLVAIHGVGQTTWKLFAVEVFLAIVCVVAFSRARSS